jgi:hypothetical protein
LVKRPNKRGRRNLTGVDLVAIILAVGLTLLVCLIIIATMVQIINNHPDTPEIQLSENATQILIAAIGGIVGVLGGYVGYRIHNNNLPPENPDDKGESE